MWTQHPSYVDTCARVFASVPCCIQRRACSLGPRAFRPDLSVGVLNLGVYSCFGRALSHSTISTNPQHCGCDVLPRMLPLTFTQ